MWTRVDLKNKAKESLKRNYWKAVLIALFLSILSGGIGSNSGWKFDQRTNYTNMSNPENIHNIRDLREALTGNNLGQGFDKMVQEFTGANQVEVFAAAFVIFIVVMIIILIVTAIMLLISAFLINPLIVGIRRFFVQDLDHKATVSEIAYGFDNSYKNIVLTMFLKNLFVFLWSLLLIVPGIVKAYEYRMIVYILGENPGMDRHAAFALSKEMMTGQKWNAFVLDLSFIGWHILSLFTVGLLNVFYVAPYQYHTNAALYNSLKKVENSDTI